MVSESVCPEKAILMILPQPESLIKTLKHEEVYLWQNETYLDVAERIPYFILDVYNRKRLHSALVYRPPKKSESILAENASTESEKAKTLFV